jgi:hypothetical protein
MIDQLYSAQVLVDTISKNDHTNEKSVKISHHIIGRNVCKHLIAIANVHVAVYSNH